MEHQDEKILSRTMSVAHFKKETDENHDEVSRP